MLKRTPFYEFHVSHGARMVDFAGWEMPIVYRGIIEEHEQTRKSGSMFDVSHMGRLVFSGKEAGTFLQRIVTRGLADQKAGVSRYGLVCNDRGGVMDDVIVSRDVKNWIMVCNAGNREKLVKYFGDRRREWGMDFDLADNTESTGMVAIQGPKVIEKLAGVLPVDWENLKRYRFETASVMLIKFQVFRSGYTGEDGVEVVLPGKMGGMAMKMIGGSMDKDGGTIRPAGLGARDTLRMEAGMPLYGHELTEEIDPISAGLGWAVDLSKEFVGVERLREIKEKGPRRKMVGLELEGKRIARQGVKMVKDGKEVGEVTSGTFGPTVQKSIAMGFVDAELSSEGTELAVDLKGTLNAARVVKLPFYKKA